MKLRRGLRREDREIRERDHHRRSGRSASRGTTQKEEWRARTGRTDRLPSIRGNTVELNKRHKKSSKVAENRGDRRSWGSGPAFPGGVAMNAVRVNTAGRKSRGYVSRQGESAVSVPRGRVLICMI